jgi:hypothetical protein
MLGSLAGLITAYNFRKEGPPPRIYDFGDEQENEKIDVSGEELFQSEEEEPSDNTIVNYTYIKKENSPNL